MNEDYMQVFESFNKLSDQQKLKFRILLGRTDEKEKLDLMKSRLDLVNDMMIFIRKPNGDPYFNIDWIAKNILKLSDEEIESNQNHWKDYFDKISLPK